MLEFPDLGKDRCIIVRNLSECFLGARPIGETWRFGHGGGGGGRNGPTVNPLDISSSKFETAGLREAMGKFLEKRKKPRTGVADPSPIPQFEVQLTDKFPVRVVTHSML